MQLFPVTAQHTSSLRSAAGEAFTPQEAACAMTQSWLFPSWGGSLPQNTGQIKSKHDIKPRFSTEKCRAHSTEGREATEETVTVLLALSADHHVYFLIILDTDSSVHLK